MFHALALDKQPPLLARFLAHLPRAFSATWYQFDWGPHLGLPFLPQVRYRRAILSPAQWRLTTANLPPTIDQWRPVLDRWRPRWDCPEVVELRDADRTLRLTLDEPTHAALLHHHLARHGQAILYRATPLAEYGWLDGHAHEIAFPLVTTRPAAPNPLHDHIPVVTNTHGQLPAAPDTRWISVKLFTHPERMTEIITEHLPGLLSTLGTPSCWWLRYRSRHETDHLRLRVPTTSGHYAKYTNMVGGWAQRMRQAGLVGWLVLDTYVPEVGRYGHGTALQAAENVFAADSTTVAALLRHHHPGVDLLVAVVANMVGIVNGFFGDPADAMTWLADRPVPATPATDRSVTDHALRLATDPAGLPGWDTEVGPAWYARADALAGYRVALPPQADTAVVLESLLHMHHNRAVGIDPEGEHTCRRLARLAALAWRARPTGGAP